MTSKKEYCPSCKARVRYGHPAPSDNWARLNIHPMTFYQMQQAAAEFDQLSSESGIYPTAQEFLDWLAPSIPGTSQHNAARNVPEAEGKAIIDRPNKVGASATRTSTPDPLPFAPIRAVLG